MRIYGACVVVGSLCCIMHQIQPRSASLLAMPVMDTGTDRCVSCVFLRVMWLIGQTRCNWVPIGRATSHTRAVHFGMANEKASWIDDEGLLLVMKRGARSKPTVTVRCRTIPAPLAVHPHIDVAMQLSSATVLLHKYKELYKSYRSEQLSTRMFVRYAPWVGCSYGCKRSSAGAAVAPVL